MDNNIPACHQMNSPETGINQPNVLQTDSLTIHKPKDPWPILILSRCTCSPLFKCFCVSLTIYRPLPTNSNIVCIFCIDECVTEKDISITWNFRFLFPEKKKYRGLLLIRFPEINPDRHSAEGILFLS